MKKMKGYKNFLGEGNFIEDFLKDVVGAEDQKKEILQTEISNFNTQSFFSWIADKIKKEDNSPVYIFNSVDSKTPFYVMSKFHDQSKLYGFEEDESGNIVIGGKKYSYCIFNCSKIETFSEEFLISDLNKILSKNSQESKKTIIEITNFSSLNDEDKKIFYNMVKDRKIGSYDLENGEFFIFSDNSNSAKGGKNLSGMIPSIFSGVNFDIIDHKFSGQVENPS